MVQVKIPQRGIVMRPTARAGSAEGGEGSNTGRKGGQKRLNNVELIVQVSYTNVDGVLLYVARM